MTKPWLVKVGVLFIKKRMHRFDTPSLIPINFFLKLNMKAELVPHNYTSFHYLCGIKTENYG